MSTTLSLASTLHSKHLLRVLNLPLSRCIVDYIVDLTIDVVNHGLGRPPSKRGRNVYRNIFHVKFRQFVDTVIYRAEVTVPMLLVASVYMARSKPFIQIAQPHWAYERVFLGALIVACKYHNDRSLKNIHWSVATGVFSPQDVSRIEREFLDVLDFELRIEEPQLLALETPLLSAFQSPGNLSKGSDPWRNFVTATEEEEVSRWSDSDSDSDNTSSSPSEDSCCSGASPVTPQSPVSITILHPKGPVYPSVQMPAPVRASLSC